MNNTTNFYKAYPSDLSDSQWAILSPLMPPEDGWGEARKYSWRTILNGIFYQLRTGGAWRYLPHDFPAWSTVYYYFRQWKLNGLWLRIHDTLRNILRVATGKKVEPSAVIVDSQSVKTSAVKGERGYDFAKKVKGRKRHILVDTQGNIVALKVHNADIAEREGAPLLLADVKTKLPRVELLWAALLVATVVSLLLNG